MLQVKKLTITHKKDLRAIITDFKFTLNARDRAVLIGEEGNGKSTILKWIYNPELIEAYAEASGERICTGERLGYLPQELEEEEKEKTLYEFFSSEEMFWNQSPKDLAKMAQMLHLPVDIFYGEQQMKTLSGGEKVKVQIARILMTEPTILLLDEPSNDIDIETLQWMEQWLVSCNQAVLYISHDETLIEKTANVIIHIEQIKRKTVSRYTVVRNTYREYMKQRQAGIEKQEQEAYNDRRQEKIRQEKFQRIQQRVEHEQNEISRQDPHGGQLLKKKMKAVKSLEHRYEREAENMTERPDTEEAIFIKFGENIRIPAGKTVVDFCLKELYTPKEMIYDCVYRKNDINLHERNSHEKNETYESNEPRLLAKDIHLKIRGAEKICIIGQNGCGKTTLLRHITKELLERKDIKVAYMPQNYEDFMDMDITPVEYLSVDGSKEEATRIRTYLGSMKYTANEMEHTIGELSGGQKAKVLLLKMSMSGADVLILDEPTRNFSPLSGPVIRDVLNSYGGAIISISHDRKYIAEVCDKVYRLTKEGLVEEA